MAPLVLGALSLLPKLPEMWNAVASLFGKETPKSVTEAGSLASDVISAFTKGQVPPEVELALEKEVNRHKERVEELALEKIKADYDFQLEQEKLLKENAADVIGLAKTEAQSTDEFVRRTRPTILRGLFNACTIYTFYAPLCVVAGYSLGIPATALTAFIEMIVWIAGWLFSTFTASFLGYATARTIDKRNPNLKDSGGVAGNIVSSLLKLK